MNGNPFRSFWMAGYECSDKVNVHGHRVDLLAKTRHLELLDEDYARLAQFSIKTVREGVRWSRVELQPYQYDWSTLRTMLDAGKRHNIQQVWDLCHFGFPDDLTPFHPLFTHRFVAMCCSFADVYFAHSDGPLIITPINEVSFLSWLGGDAGATVPYCTDSGWKVKYALMRAYIQAVAALKNRYPDVIVLSTEPLVNIVPPLDGSEQDVIRAAAANDDQFQAMDMLTGRICPELGGKPEYLDILGLNYYYSNQFELDVPEPLPWVNISGDPRWKPLSEMLHSAYLRYGVPIILAETSHPGEHRPNWLTYVSEECAVIVQRGIPLLGICLYPIVSRPDWDDLDYWHHSGLWDIAISDDHTRILNQEYALALIHSAHLMSTLHKPELINRTSTSYGTALLAGDFQKHSL